MHTEERGKFFACEITKRCLWPFIVFALIFLLLLSPAYASELPAADVAETPIYVDVPLDYPWYDGVVYATEMGITNGIGNGKFGGEDYVTVTQLAVMLCRAFNAEVQTREGAAFGAAEIEYCVDKEWLPSDAYFSPTACVCRRYLYQCLTKAADIPSFNSELFGSTENRYMRLAKEIGLCEDDAKALDFMTRGETVYAMYYLLTQEITPQIPENIAAIKIVNVDNAMLAPYYEALQYIPDVLLEEFSARGWQIKIDDDSLTQYSIQFGFHCSGVISYSQKTIYLRDPNSTDHEFGHFLMYLLGNECKADAKELYAAEAENAKPALGRYSLTNYSEFFAELFAYYIEHSHGIVLMYRLKNLSPVTYDYICELADSGWGLSPSR